MKLKKKSMLFCLVTGCAIIMPAMTAYGQKNDTTKTELLDEVVITATRNEKNLNNIGRSVTVITNDDIKKSGALTFSEVINSIEGLYVVGAHQNPGTLNNLSVRGSLNSHVVVMIDGIKISDPSSTDNSVDLTEFSLANIDRIEIVRGSHSTLYGSSAIGGVVNIITRLDNDTPGIHADAVISGGAFGNTGLLLSENLSLNYTDKSGFYLTGEAYNISSKGINSTIDTISRTEIYKHPDMNDGFRKTDLVARTGYKNNNLDLYAGLRYINHNLDVDDGAFKDDDNYTVDLERKLYTYGAAYNFDKGLSLKFIGGNSDLTRKAVDDSSMISSAGETDKTWFSGKYSGSFANHEIQMDYNSRAFDVVLGIGSDRETMSADTYYYSESWGVYISKGNLDSLKIKSTTHNAFIHTDVNGSLINESLKPFSLGLGARYIRHSTFGSIINYEVNPSVKLGPYSLLYLSYSTGFNAPSLYQLYSPEMDFMSGITRGNYSLDPEKSVSWEIGIKQKVDNRIWWSINYYMTIINDCIDYVYLWNKSQEINSLTYLDYSGDTYINLGTQTNQGIEFSIRSKISDRISVGGKLNLVNGKLKYNPADIDNAHTDGNHIQLYSNGIFISKETERLGLARRPNTANINIIWLPYDNFSLMADLSYVGSRNDVSYDAGLGPFGALGSVGMEAYTLVDLRIRYDIFKGFAVKLHAENLLNTSYCEIMGYSTRGRCIYGGISYSF